MCKKTLCCCSRFELRIGQANAGKLEGSLEDLY